MSTLSLVFLFSLYLAGAVFLFFFDRNEQRKCEKLNSMKYPPDGICLCGKCPEDGPHKRGECLPDPAMHVRW